MRAYGVKPDLPSFVDLFWWRLVDPKLKLPKALEVTLPEVARKHGADPSARVIADNIAAHAAAEVMRLEQKLFVQRKRLADTETKLAIALTKAAGASASWAEYGTATSPRWQMYLVCSRRVYVRRFDLRVEQLLRRLPGRYLYGHTWDSGNLTHSSVVVTRPPSKSQGFDSAMASVR